MDYNIALLPPSGATDALVEFSANIAGAVVSEFSLGPGALPHITVYLAGIPPHSLSTVIARAQEETLRYGASPVVVAGWTVIRDLVMLKCAVSAQIELLHRDIVNRIAPLRDRQPAEIWQRGIDTMDQRQHSLLQQFGFPYGLELWKPHITIARCAPADLERIEKPLNAFRLEFVAEDIAVGTVGNAGTFTRALSSWRLGSFHKKDQFA